MAARTYVMLTIKTADAGELAAVEEGLSAALPGATIEATHRFVTDLTQLEPETRAPALLPVPPHGPRPRRGWR